MSLFKHGEDLRLLQLCGVGPEMTPPASRKGAGENPGGSLCQACLSAMISGVSLIGGN